MKKKVIICSVISVLLIAGAVFVYLDKTSYKPPAFSDQAMEGTPEVDEKCDYHMVDLPMVTYKTYLCGVPNATKKSVDLCVTNHESNDIYMLAQIYNSDDEKIAQTGLIKPGQYIKNINLSKPLNAGENKIKIHVCGFEKETFYSAGTMRLELTVDVPEE